MGLLDDAIREHLDLKRRRGADPTEVEREEREVLGPVRRRGDPAPDDELSHAPDDDLEHEPLPDDGEEWDDWHEEQPAEAAPRPAAFDHEEIAPLRPDAEVYDEPGLPAAPYAGREPDVAPEPHAAPESYVAPEPYVAPERDAGREPYAAPEPHAAPEPSRYAEAERELYAGADPAAHRAPEPHVAPEPEPHAAPEPYTVPEPHVDPVPEPERYRADTGHQPPPEEQTAEFNVEGALAEEHPPHPPGHEEEDVLEETPEFLQDTPDHDRLWFEQRPPRDFDFDG